MVRAVWLVNHTFTREVFAVGRHVLFLGEKIMATKSEARPNYVLELSELLNRVQGRAVFLSSAIAEMFDSCAVNDGLFYIFEDIDKDCARMQAHIDVLLDEASKNGGLTVSVQFPESTPDVA